MATEMLLLLLLLLCMQRSRRKKWDHNGLSRNRCGRAQLLRYSIGSLSILENLPNKERRNLPPASLKLEEPMALHDRSNVATISNWNRLILLTAACLFSQSTKQHNTMCHQLESEPSTAAYCCCCYCCYYTCSAVDEQK